MSLNCNKTLFFIAKSLTISLEEKNRDEIKNVLKTKQIDWEKVVKLSTAHYVLPALYCNLKFVNFLQYLPQDLVLYMKYISDINRKRNKQIIEQAKSINSLLLDNSITPLFLKGTGNLLAGLYYDIAERMVGDIDFILSEKDYPKAIKILRDFGYYDLEKYHFPIQCHYGRLQKESHIAAIEIHSKLLNIKKFNSEFNYSFVKKDHQLIKGFRVLSYANKLNLSIVANQINSNGFYFQSIALRNAYDVFLLSKKTNAKDAINRLNKLNNYLNCFLATCHEVFNSVDSLSYIKTKKATTYLRLFNLQFTNNITIKIQHKIIKIYLFLKSRLNIVYKSLIYKEYRIWLFKRLTDKNWYNEKVIKLGSK